MRTRSGKEEGGRKLRRYTPEERRAAVEAYHKSGLTQALFARQWGVSHVTLGCWLKREREAGPKGLERVSAGPARRRGTPGSLLRRRLPAPLSISSRRSRLLGVVLLALPGCVHEREKAVPTLPEGVLSRSPRLESSSREVARAPRDVSPPVARAQPPPRSHEAPQQRPSPPAHVPLPPGASLEVIARERFVASETTLDAEKVTLYAPVGYSQEIALEGASVAEESPGRRTATGGATLRFRRLTVRAERITVALRAEGPEDIQLSARGNVSFRSDQPASRIEETGLRSLLIRNDAYTPFP